jgi:hypothetical protein
VPLNAVKKRTIFATVLRNLKAPFAGSKTVIAGANLRYTPIDIGKQATQYRNERGWFGDNNFTFAGLPTGRQTFAGVTYQITTFRHRLYQPQSCWVVTACRTICRKK